MDENISNGSTRSELGKAYLLRVRRFNKVRRQYSVLTDRSARIVPIIDNFEYEILDYFFNNGTVEGLQLPGLGPVTFSHIENILGGTNVGSEKSYQIPQGHSSRYRQSRTGRSQNSNKYGGHL